jgi:hypothetical protein
VANSLAGPVDMQVATAGHFPDYPEYEQELLELARATKEFFAG